MATMSNNFSREVVKPGETLAGFVEHFSSLQNLSALSGGIIIPNGRIDIQFSITMHNKFAVSLVGLETKPKSLPVQNDYSTFFTISFYPLAAEYIFHRSVAGILDNQEILPDDFWGFSMDDLGDFEAFCKKASQKIQSQITVTIDERKRRLFELIFASNGEVSIKELAAKVHWSARQINQYFNQQFGLSLKSYCNILRFQASLSHIQQGRLFPELNYFDQSHFIKEIKKLSGASPKELFKNQNSRFLQFLHKQEK
jgi:AraC-like DNA-binding protein